MTTGEMLQWTHRLHSILAGSAETRDERLAAMMTDLEAMYEIPLMTGERLEAFRMRNPFALMLYQTVSEWRWV